MIIIDGRQAEIELNSFENLQEVLIKVMSEDALQQRVVTDVLVNKEQFSEIYPHQAEDIGCSEIEQLEIQTVGVVQMAYDISCELGKVCNVLTAGSREIASLFRQADDAEALEMLQDLLDATRDFLNMLALLRNEYAGVAGNVPDFNNNVENISNLLGEMTEVLENEDWILLSDLLEYEFLPLMDNWERAIAYLQDKIGKGSKYLFIRS
jgi:hypothetical protein